MNTDAIEKEALALPVEARARLVDKLLESLDDDMSDPLGGAWGEEIERRREEVRQGRVTPVAGEEVSRKAWELAKSASL
jgi:putative addiction module component (TIGR02574 family)